MSTEKPSIKEMPADERPREKAMAHGVATLSTAELLALLIGTGNDEETAVSLMKKVLASCGDSIARLARHTVDDLCRFKGIGPAKAITIVAACELWKRQRFAEQGEQPRIKCSADIYEYFHPIMFALNVEEIYLLMLNI